MNLDFIFICVTVITRYRERHLTKKLFYVCSTQIGGLSEKYAIQLLLTRHLDHWYLVVSKYCCSEHTCS